MTDTAELEDWLRRDYPTAFRTACLVLGEPEAAEQVTRDAFLHTWRARSAIPSGDRRTAWLYRALVSGCRSRSVDEQAPAGTDAVQRSLADLPIWLRIPLVLQSFTGLSPAQIVVAIDRRASAVTSQLTEARQRLSLDPHLSTLEVSR